MPESEDNKVIKNVDISDCLEQLRQLLKENSKLKNLQYHNIFLERYLYGADFHVEAAFYKMKNYYEMVIEYPSWFRIEGPLDQKAIIDKNIRVMTPRYDKEGRPIYIIKLGNIDTNIMTLLDIITIDNIWMEAVLASDPHITKNGLCAVVDVANSPWKMLKWMTPENMKLCIKNMLYLPFKEYRVHLVNTSVVVNAALKICWPFLPASIKEMIKYHNDDCSSLYKYIDKEALPIEYGGTYNINYSELQETLYARNEEIVELLKMKRELVCI